MSGTFRVAALGAAIAASVTCAPAIAYEAGDLMLRVGAAGVYPNSDYDKNDLGGAGVEVESAWSLGITFSYMLSDQLGVGVLAAWPFEHDIKGDGTLASDDVATFKHLPPTVTLQWYFPTGTNIHPYVGAGLNYTFIYDEETKGALNGVDLELDDSYGLAGEAGIDFELDNNWLVSGQVWYIDINTEADLKGVGKLDVEVDPWVYMLSVGKKF